MLFRFFFLLVGFGLAVAGGVSIMAYLNLLTAGHDFSGYIKFILHRVEFYLILIGLVLVVSSLVTPNSKKRKK